MTKEILKTKTEDEIKDFIRERLSFIEVYKHLSHVDPEMFKKEHKRFNMSGYENKTGECTVLNIAILNEFADLGIYNYTSYLFVDFHKGNCTIYYQYFFEKEHNEIELCSGLGTVDIIYEVFKLTILTDGAERRRN